MTTAEIHYTEGGPRLTDHYDTDFCKWGLMAAKTLGAGYRSFTGWNLMLDVEGVLVENHDGKKIALIVNPADTGTQAQIEIGGVLWYLELLADSVSTIIIEG